MQLRKTRPICGHAVLRNTEQASQQSQDKINICHCNSRGSSKPRAGAGITKARHSCSHATLNNQLATNPSHAGIHWHLPPAQDSFRDNKSYDQVIATAAPLRHACVNTACGRPWLTAAGLSAGCPGTTETSVKHTSWTMCRNTDTARSAATLTNFQQPQKQHSRGAALVTNHTKLSCQESCYGAEANCQGDASGCHYAGHKPQVHVPCMPAGIATARANVLCPVATAIHGCVMCVWVVWCRGRTYE